MASEKKYTITLLINTILKAAGLRQASVDIKELKNGIASAYAALVGANRTWEKYAESAEKAGEAVQAAGQKNKDAADGILGPTAKYVAGIGAVWGAFRGGWAIGEQVFLAMGGSLRLQKSYFAEAKDAAVRWAHSLFEVSRQQKEIAVDVASQNQLNSPSDANKKALEAATAALKEHTAKEKERLAIEKERGAVATLNAQQEKKDADAALAIASANLVAADKSKKEYQAAADAKLAALARVAAADLAVANLEVDSHDREIELARVTAVSLSAKSEAEKVFAIERAHRAVVAAETEKEEADAALAHSVATRTKITESRDGELAAIRKLGAAKLAELVASQAIEEDRKKVIENVGTQIQALRDKWKDEDETRNQTSVDQHEQAEDEKVRFLLASRLSSLASTEDASQAEIDFIDDATSHWEGSYRYLGMLLTQRAALAKKVNAQTLEDERKTEEASLAGQSATEAQKADAATQLATLDADIFREASRKKAELEHAAAILEINQHRDVQLTKAQIDALEVAANEKKNADIKVSDAKALEIAKQTAQQRLSTIASVLSAVAGLLSKIDEYEAAKSAEKVKRIERDRDRTIAAERAKGHSTLALEKQFNKQIEYEKKKAFEQHKKYQLVMADINAAAAIVSAWATANNVYAAAAFTVIIALENELQKAIIRKSTYQGSALTGRDTTKEGMYHLHDGEAVPEAGPAEAMRRVGALLERMGPDQVMQGAAMASVAQGTREVGSAIQPRGVNVLNYPEAAGATHNDHSGPSIDLKGATIITQNSTEFQRWATRGSDTFRWNIEDRNTRR